MGIFSPGQIDPVSMGAGIVSSGISGLMDVGFSKMKAKQQWKYQKKAMDLQHQYELENLAAQEESQRSLAKDASSLRKLSLQKAGYSTADPEGTGTVAPTVSGPSTSASGSFSLPSSNYAPGLTVSDLANANLMNSQAELNRIEAQYRAKKLSGEIGLLQQNIEQIKQKLPQEVNQIKANVDKLRSEKRVNDFTADRINAEIDKLAAETQAIKIDNRFRPDMNTYQVKKLEAEANNLLKDGRVKDLEALLADKGILAGSNWFATLASVVASGKSGEIMSEITDGLSSVLSQFPEAVGQIFNTLLSTLADIPDSVLNKIIKGSGADKVVGKVKSAYGKGKVLYDKGKKKVQGLLD